MDVPNFSPNYSSRRSSVVSAERFPATASSPARLLERMLFKKLRLTSPWLPLRRTSNTVSYWLGRSVVDVNMGQRRKRLRRGSESRRSSCEPLRRLPAGRGAGGSSGAELQKRACRGRGGAHTASGSCVRDRWCTVEGPHVLPFTPSAGTGITSHTNCHTRCI